MTPKQVGALRSQGYLVHFDGTYATIVGEIEMRDGRTFDGARISWDEEWKRSLPVNSASRDLLRKILGKMPGRRR